MGGFHPESNGAKRTGKRCVDGEVHSLHSYYCVDYVMSM